MIAVLVLPGPSAEMFGLDSQRTLSLLPLGDRPMLQHIVDSLVAHGVKSIELIVGHAPERVEALLGNGDRWGCKFRYHLSVQADRPYRSLKIIAETKTVPWMLVHAERFPCVELPVGVVDRPVLYFNRRPPALNGTVGPTILEERPASWGGAAVFPAGPVTEAFANQTASELCESVLKMAAGNVAEVVTTSDWIDASTPAALLDTQAKLLGKRLGSVMMGGMERQPGVWISRSVAIHPTAELVAPVYIGPNTRLNRGVRVGPNAVISGYCIIDSNSTIENSLVKGGSYIGEGLELNRAIVDHNLLVNASLGTSIDIFENFLLGAVVQAPSKRLFRRSVQSVLALLLIVLFLPVSLLSVLYYALARSWFYTTVEVVRIPSDDTTLAEGKYDLPCIGADAWSVQRPAGWSAFLRQFLPGLFAILAGRLSFVGLPPRTMEQIDKLSPEWRSVYLDGKAGLISEVSVATTDFGDETQLYLADAYYAVKRRWHHDFWLAMRYFLRLAVPGHHRPN